MSVFGAASGSREATETSGSSGLLEASPLFFPHLPPSAVGISLSLIRSFLEHLETSRSNPMLVTGWVSKARAIWFPGLSPGPSLQTQGDPAWERRRRRRPSYQCFLPWRCILSRTDLPGSPTWHRAGIYFSHARRLSPREHMGPDTGHTAGHR